MFAIVAAIFFLIAFLLDVFGGHLGLSVAEWEIAGLFFFALHFAYTGGWGRNRR
jgi:hypothetical protein